MRSIKYTGSAVLLADWQLLSAPTPPKPVKRVNMQITGAKKMIWFLHPSKIYQNNTLKRVAVRNYDIYNLTQAGTVFQRLVRIDRIQKHRIFAGLLKQYFCLKNIILQCREFCENPKNTLWGRNFGSNLLVRTIRKCCQPGWIKDSAVCFCVGVRWMSWALHL